MGPEGGRPGRPTQAVRNTCSGKLEILKYYAILGQTCTLSLQQTRSYYILPNSPNPPMTVLHWSHNETVKLDKKRTDRAVITVNIM